MSVRDVGQRIEHRVSRAGGVCSGEETTKLASYLGLLAKWNSKINLTALSIDPPSDESIDRLIVEPVIASKWLGDTDRLILDVGSGGGSPAIPIKLMAPGIRLVMVEIKARKAAFLREAVRVLGLKDTEVSNSSLEELLSRPDLHEVVDIVTLRAVRADARLWSTVSGLLKPRGRVFWFGSALLPNPGTPVLPAMVVDSRHMLVPSLGSHLSILRRIS